MWLQDQVYFSILAQVEPVNTNKKFQYCTFIAKVLKYLDSVFQGQNFLKNFRPYTHDRDESCKLFLAQEKF